MFTAAAGKATGLSRAVFASTRSVRIHQVPALSRFHSTLLSPVPDLDNQAQAASVNSKYTVVYNEKLAKGMLQYSKKKDRGGLMEMARVLKEIENKSVPFNLDTWVYKLQLHVIRKETAKVLSTFHKIVTKYTPSVDVFNLVMKSVSLERTPIDLAEIFDIMEQRHVKPNGLTYFYMIRNMLDYGQLEQALDVHDKALKEGIRPNALSYDQLVRGCGAVDESELGWNMLQDADKANLPLSITAGIAMPLLRSAAKHENVDIVKGIWELIKRRKLSLPDDGAALAVLNLAGKTGDTELASQMIDSLGQQGHQYQEQHFAPLVEAFVAQGDIKGAFSVLDIMRSFNIPASKRTASPILESIQDDVNKIDEAFYALEKIKKEGTDVDVISFNVVLGACVKARDLHRSISTYQEASKLGVQANIDTYNYALDACVLARNRQMGDLILSHMKEAKVRPNVATYTKRIMLSCTQSNYEDAFMYLEEMKQYNIIPPRVCYEHLVRKLVRESDPRIKVALEEMETFGLEVTPFLQQYIANKGRRNPQEPSRKQTSSS